MRGEHRHESAAIATLVALAGGAAAQVGGNYDLHWNVTGAGGAKMNGGVYTLNGTVGQPDVSATGAMTGASNTALYGGFWKAGVSCDYHGDAIFCSGFESQ
jgi:hypothetical protein